MARISRLVVPGYQHHVTQRGVRSIPIFSSDKDRSAYAYIMAEDVGTGLNSFTLTAKQWIEATDTIGIVSKSGRYGGTYAYRDIAFEPLN
jgi:hypothetical protein